MIGTHAFSLCQSIMLNILNCSIFVWPYVTILAFLSAVGLNGDSFYLLNIKPIS